MRVLLSYFFMQKLWYYQCSYWLYNNVQRFSEREPSRREDTRGHARNIKQLKISVCSAGRHRRIALPLEEVIFLYRHCQTWLLLCLKNHSKAQNRFAWKGITWHLQYFPRAESSKGLPHRTVWRAKNSLIAQCCEDRSVMLMLNVSHNFFNGYLCHLHLCSTLGLAEECTFWRRSRAQPY